MHARFLSAALVTALIAGCSSAPSGRYSMAQDEAPQSAPDLAHLEQPVPRYEPHSRGGNRDYQVWGIAYEVLPSAEDYQAEGIASWYGAKFHGHLTSNGETYDMYSFSAAHRSLPLPTYAKVTNLSNNKSVIVRINDRGPFHPDREIDLSYAAAWHLDMLQSGTAQVKVEAYHFDGPPSPSQTEQTYIQLLASGDQARIQQLKAQLSEQYSAPLRVTQQDSLYKLQLGPFDAIGAAEQWLKQLQLDGYTGAFKVSDTKGNN
ncbi:septal ring lytic transglycosylase RlpA family protein [Ferrimonas marina]|uniref:Endolytic peptidoglycan transglycosylase RlpA n=1 Tax=Ferrimonas marina TaxID=299255 RepID=A0A1M5W084_9GAMM|nr:septal ring lytic transglycosylase RlpA family protein [Ferrimonas marina]SHH80915.1 rare lipoprotein A [Ferrimonas marina]